jgi:hypothetical protein
VYVDRWDKRLVLFGSNLLRVGIVPMYLFTADVLPLAYVVNFLFATVSQFFGPAEGASIPALVERRLLMQANSLFHLTFTASQVVGLVLVGPLVVGTLGVDGLFITVTVLFGMCAALVWPLPSMRAHQDPAHQGALRDVVAGLVQDVREVFQFFRSDAIVSLAVGHWTLGAILSIVIAMLAPAYVVKVLDLEAEQSVFLLAPAGLGMFVGTVLISRRHGKVNKQALIHAGLLATCAALAGLALAEAFWSLGLGVARLGAGSPRIGLLGMVMLMALATGMAFVAIIVPSQTIMQERAPLGLRGRVISIALMIGNVISVMPLLFLGTFADVVGVEPTFGLLGVVMLIVLLVSRQLDRRFHHGDRAAQGRSGTHG